MNNWEFIEAEKLYKKVTDGTHDSPKFTDKGYPLVTSKNIKDGVLDLSAANIISNRDYDEINKRSKVEQWDVIISMIGEYCGFTYIEKNTSIKYAVKNVGLFKTSSELEANWLSYYLKSDYGKHFLKQSRSGSSQPYISLGALRGLKILNPSFEIKQGIVNAIKPLDTKIELNNRINAELEAMAKTIYDYWFVQFDFPDKDGKPYKSSGGKMVWNEELKREIPEGWEVKHLGDYANIKKGVLITEKIANTSGNIKVVSAGLDFSYYHSESNYPENTITISASGASAGFINFWREPIFACDCTTVRGTTIADTLQILGFLKMRQDFIYKQARGSAQPHVYPKDVEGLSYPIPPRELVENYGEYVEAGNEKIAINIKENQQLTSLRDWLLPMLMNGQVKIQ